jgi:hypothetical protein
MTGADRVAVAATTAVDALAYALTVAAITTLVALGVTALTGGGLVRTKTVLFLAGWALITYATVRLWPSSPSDLETDRQQTAGAGRLQRAVESKPPVRWLDSGLLAQRRLSEAGKLFLAGVAVLLLSLLMETAGGVG